MNERITTGHVGWSPDYKSATPKLSPVDVPRLVGRSSWQPIDSAPTNQAVLIYIPNAEHYGEGIYRGMLVDMGTGKRWTTTALSMGRDCGTTWQPTHWMPLPPSPNAEVSDR